MKIYINLVYKIVLILEIVIIPVGTINLGDLIE